MITITRIFPFDAAHRVLGHEGKCANLHGHGYVAEVTVASPELDKLGRVIDFSCLKEIIGGWIDEYWDHNIILSPADPLAKLYVENEMGGDQIFGKKAPYFLPPGWANPTAENMGRELFTRAQKLLGKNRLTECILIQKVRIWETQKCYSDFYPNDSSLCCTLLS